MEGFIFREDYYSYIKWGMSSRNVYEKGIPNLRQKNQVGQTYNAFVTKRQQVWEEEFQLAILYLSVTITNIIQSNLL